MSIEEERERLRKLALAAQSMQGLPKLLLEAAAQSRPKTAEEARKETRQMVNVWPTPSHEVSITYLKKRWWDYFRIWRRT